MSKPSIADIELGFYERFFFSQGIEPYPTQEKAFNHIFAGDSVLVTVPTGTGKTMMAKAALYKALELGQRAVYTTPLRALTEEKYRELGYDFGAGNVGFATGDFKVNRDAPIQVEVAEILWNRIFGDRATCPADVVVMDEGHYFNDPSRGYVWEQSIIGLDPRTQLIILSATVGHPDRFCHWVELTRRLPMALVESRERRVPLHHEYREEYLIDVVRDLNAKGDVPAIIFVFGREKCFEVARLLKSCRRFTSDEERTRIAALCDKVLLDVGAGPELRPLLEHGIGIHHAGIMPRYKQLVEELALERLIKFVVSTETIAAGINLPAKIVVFPSLCKHVKGKSRLVLPAEFHQMAGRAGRPQFDNEGLAIAMAPEEVVQEIRKEVKEAQKRGHRLDEEKIRKSVYARARSAAQRAGEAFWDAEVHQQLVKGEPAELRSKTVVTPEQVLAIGLPDLASERLPGADLASEASAPIKQPTEEVEEDAAEEPAGALPEPPTGALAEALAKALDAGSDAGTNAGAKAAETQAPAASKPEVSPEVGPEVSPEVSPEVRVDSASAPLPPSVPAAAAAEPVQPKPLPDTDVPPYMRLNIATVVDNLLLTDRERRQAHKLLAQVTDNLRAVGVIDEHGQQVAGFMIRQLQGLDGLFIWYVLMNEQLDYEDCRELVEYLVDNDIIQRQLNRKLDDKRRDWIRERLRELRMENPHISWDDVEAEYERTFPRELTRIERIHQSFAAVVPHPELHGGKTYKNIWAMMEDEDLFFTEFVDKHGLAHEEGNLFSYLIRVMNFARTLHEVTTMGQFASIATKVRHRLAVVDIRMVDEETPYSNSSGWQRMGLHV